MHQRKSKKILIYFFLFLIIGSLNNKNLININFAKINEITVKGLDDKNNLELMENLKFLKLNNLFFLKKKDITDIINSNNLVENYSVYKKYPSTINIEIDKAKFLAQLKKDNKLYLLGSNGRLIEKTNYKDNIPFIFGDFNNKNFFELKDVIDKSSFDYGDIKNFFFFKSGRWDIETKNGLLIKLPKDNLKKSFQFLNSILNQDKEKKIIKIDLRQYNQIIIYE